MYDFLFPDTSFTTFTMLRQTWAAVNKVAETKLAKVGLTPEKVAVLWACRDYPGTITPAEISRLVFRENQTIAGLLNRMEKEGLVKRIPKRKGHPFTEVKLTEKGEKACGPGIAVMKGLITELLAALSVEKQEQLQSLMRVLRDRSLQELYMEAKQPRGYPPGKPVPVKW
jgi:MarR family transcriptional regulator for hemolysin